MARKRYQVAIKKNQSFTLNITSMTDMFTILLIFLLQSFAAGEVQIDAVQGVRLPSSTNDKNPVNGVKISISPTELKLDQTVLAKVSNSLIDQSALDLNDAYFIKPLFDQLEELNKKNPKLAKMGKILLLADESLPYLTIRKIMYTASMAGFPNVKLITTVGNSYE